MLRRRFFLLLGILAVACAYAQQDTFSGVEKIVAIGDLHGDFKQFVTLLRQAELVDSGNKWIGGKTHLVQTGDVPDRGSDTRMILDLLMDLEKPARKAGGYIHSLIGNHEAMNVYGDLRYVSPGEYGSFQDSRSEAARADVWQQHVEELRSSGRGRTDDAYRSKWEVEHPLGWVEHRRAFGPNGKYGRWIRDHNSVLKINDILFLHGGISPKYAGQSTREINERIRKELANFQLLQGGAAMDDQGPLWYRGLAIDPESALAAHVDTVLKAYGVKHVVVGHTPTPGAIMPRFNSKVLVIDVGLSAVYGGRQACLIADGQKMYALHRGARIEIPADSGTGLLAYLKRAASFDPKPSPLEKYIANLEQRLAGGEN